MTVEEALPILFGIAFGMDASLAAHVEYFEGAI
jgi:hypothetical protein